MVRRRVRLLVLGLLAAAAPAQDADMQIREARQTLDELLKAGDELVRQGKHEAALETYREATRAYDEAMRRIEETLLGPPVDPPAGLAHLADTPRDLRRKIDDLVAVLLDPRGGRDALQAKEELERIGKPAFPRILGAMAGIRDRIADDDTAGERRLESALKLGDECLRALDGYLDGQYKPPVRPGTDKNYIVYILRLHYRRWNGTLKDLDEMPGPYRPAGAKVSRRWDPPGWLDCPRGTPAAQRQEVAALVDTLFDPKAGRESGKAMDELIAIGMPAFPAILGRMARVPLTLADEDTLRKLKLGDECLRRIDPHLDRMGAPALRPGADPQYVRYILRLHYQRWVEVLSKEDD
jgi:hypothetical protein